MFTNPHMGKPIGAAPFAASTLELLVTHSLHTLREFFLVDHAVAIDTIDEGKGLAVGSILSNLNTKIIELRISQVYNRA